MLGRTPASTVNSPLGWLGHAARYAKSTGFSVIPVTEATFLFTARTDGLIAASSQWAEKIMQKIDERFR